MAYPWHFESLQALLARTNRLPHALLIRGREGIGKLAFAGALARALLCESRKLAQPACGKCVACGWMEQGSHPDFRKLEPASLAEPAEVEEEGDRKKGLQIEVEQVRSLTDFIQLTSHRRGAKVVVIHPAEALNPSAGNALLKNLEEPPPQTYFLLVAHRWHQLLPTIRSRCEQVVLMAPARELARDWLGREKLRDPDLALAHAGGAPLLALGFDEGYWQQREALFKAITRPDFDPLSSAEQLKETAPRLIVAWLQKWASDLVRHKVTGKVSYNPDYSEAIARAASGVGLSEALRYQRLMIRQQRIVAHPLNARLFLEQLLLDYSALLRHAG